MYRPMWAIKFKLYAKKNNLKAKDLSDIMGVSIPTIYTYFAGTRIPKDEAKKRLENKIGFDIYDIFYNPEMSEDNERS